MFDANLVRQNVPDGMVEQPQWVGWKLINRDGKLTKAPIDPHTGNFADSTNPATWGTFEQSLSACTRFTTLAGVGFVFTADDEFAGIDLDDCVVPETGEIKPWAKAIIDQFNSYAEISPSGTGAKIFIKGRKPGERCRTAWHDGEIELYDQARFFCTTGQIVEGVSRNVEARQEQFDALYAEVFGVAKGEATVDQNSGQQNQPPVALTDDEIIRLASSEKRKGGRGEKFAALWNGQWNSHFNSPSEADSSVVFTLAYYTKDASQIDRLFRQSKLFRPKWDEQRGGQTYGQITIDKALSKVTGQYRPKRRAKLPAPKPGGGPPDDLPPLYRFDEVARLFIEANRRIIYWRDVFHLYGGSCYMPLTEAELGARIATFIIDVAWWTRPARKQNGEWEDGAVPHPDYGNLMVVLEKVIPKTGDIREIMLQLKTDFLPDVVEAPCWTGGATGPVAGELVACRNGLLHLPSGQMHDHSDALFSLNAVDYDYLPDAPCPESWLAFMEELFGDDAEAIDALQEMFGYYLLPDTAQQKIGLIVGPKRSGKGTIGRVLTGVLGRANVCGPTLGSLGTNFGLWPLLHKQLAIISDARLSGRTDQAVVVERLLSISGEDTITVDRKHLTPWTGKLPTRFLILTNELPKLNDASGALAGRFILLCLTHSWFGREDHTLTDRLLADLPGILNWAIAGWRRLRERGYFVQPASSQEAIRQVEDLGSPIGAFVRDRCLVALDVSVEINELFAAWQDYCRDTGRANAGTIQGFGRDLRAALPGLQVSHPRAVGGRIRFYEGISLRPEEEAMATGTHGTRSYSLHV